METSTDEILSTKEYTDHIYLKYLYISNIFLVLLGVRDIENEVREHFLSFGKKDD